MHEDDDQFVGPLTKLIPSNGQAPSLPSSHSHSQSSTSSLFFAPTQIDAGELQRLITESLTTLDDSILSMLQHLRDIKASISDQTVYSPHNNFREREEDKTIKIKIPLRLKNSLHQQKKNSNRLIKKLYNLFTRSSNNQTHIQILKTHQHQFMSLSDRFKSILIEIEQLEILEGKNNISIHNNHQQHHHNNNTNNNNNMGVHHRNTIYNYNHTNNNNKEEEHEKEVLLVNHQALPQLIVNNDNTMINEINNRSESIQSLNKMVMEVKTMFDELDHIVQKQQEDLNQIEDHISLTKSNTIAAEQEIRKASNYMAKSMAFMGGIMGAALGGPMGALVGAKTAMGVGLGTIAIGVGGGVVGSWVGAGLGSLRKVPLAFGQSNSASSSAANETKEKQMEVISNHKHVS